MTETRKQTLWAACAIALLAGCALLWPNSERQEQLTECKRSPILEIDEIEVSFFEWVKIKSCQIKVYLPW